MASNEFLALRTAVRPFLTTPVLREGDSSSRTGRRTRPSPEEAEAARELVLVALSGGADSLSLLVAALAEAPAAGVEVGAVVVDHALQDGSADVAAGVAADAVALGAEPVEVVRVAVGADGGPEAAARDARYAALAEAARRLDAAVVLLGHTREDQAETVLLRLARGSGARSLAGMRAEVTRHDVRFVRPLLGLRRATTVAACRDLGLDPWSDPHNADPSFTRVRVRRELLPAISDVLGDGAVAALARSADLLRDDADALDDWAGRAFALARRDDDPAGLDLEVLEPLPPAVRRRVVRLGALAAGVPAGPLTAAHVASLDALVRAWHGQGPVALPGPVEAARTCGRLTFRGR